MDMGLLVVRLVIGLTLAGHGLQKLLGWFDGPGLRQSGVAFEALGYRPGKHFALAGSLAEAIGGVLLAAGLLTPLAAAALMSAMLGASLSTHLQNGFWLKDKGVEYTLILGAVAGALAFTGAGSYSLDHALGWNLSGVWWGELSIALALGTGIPIEVYRRHTLQGSILSP
jgi:putative oxidoreductase